MFESFLFSIPVDVLGLGTSGTCNQQAACCKDVSSKHTPHITILYGELTFLFVDEGLVPLGIDCSPINAGL